MAAWVASPQGLTLTERSRERKRVIVVTGLTASSLAVMLLWGPEAFVWSRLGWAAGWPRWLAPAVWFLALNLAAMVPLRPPRFREEPGTPLYSAQLLAVAGLLALVAASLAGPTFALFVMLLFPFRPESDESGCLYGLVEVFFQWARLPLAVLVFNPSWKGLDPYLLLAITLVGVAVLLVEALVVDWNAPMGEATRWWVI